LGYVTLCYASPWGLGVSLTTPHRKNQLVTKCYSGARNWASPCEHGNEPSGSILASQEDSAPYSQ